MWGPSLVGEADEVPTAVLQQEDRILSELFFLCSHSGGASFSGTYARLLSYCLPKQLSKGFVKDTFRAISREKEELDYDEWCRALGIIGARCFDDETPTLSFRRFTRTIDFANLICASVADFVHALNCLQVLNISFCYWDAYRLHRRYCSRGFRGLMHALKSCEGAQESLVCDDLSRLAQLLLQVDKSSKRKYSASLLSTLDRLSPVLIELYPDMGLGQTFVEFIDRLVQDNLIPVLCATHLQLSRDEFASNVVDEVPESTVSSPIGSPIPSNKHSIEKRETKQADSEQALGVAKQQQVEGVKTENKRGEFLLDRYRERIGLLEKESQSMNSIECWLTEKHVCPDLMSLEVAETCWKLAESFAQFLLHLSLASGLDIPSDDTARFLLLLEFLENPNEAESSNTGAPVASQSQDEDVEDGVDSLVEAPALAHIFVQGCRGDLETWSSSQWFGFVYFYTFPLPSWSDLCDILGQRSSLNFAEFLETMQSLADRNVVLSLPCNSSSKVSLKNGELDIPDVDLFFIQTMVNCWDTEQEKRALFDSLVSEWICRCEGNKYSILLKTLLAASQDALKNNLARGLVNLVCGIFAPVYFRVAASISGNDKKEPAREQRSDRDDLSPASVSTIRLLLDQFEATEKLESIIDVLYVLAAAFSDGAIQEKQLLLQFLVQDSEPPHARWVCSLPFVERQLLELSVEESIEDLQMLERAVAPLQRVQDLKQLASKSLLASYARLSRKGSDCEGLEDFDPVHPALVVESVLQVAKERGTRPMTQLKMLLKRPLHLSESKAYDFLFQPEVAVVIQKAQKSIQLFFVRFGEKSENDHTGEWVMSSHSFLPAMHALNLSIGVCDTVEKAALLSVLRDRETLQEIFECVSHGRSVLTSPGFVEALGRIGLACTRYEEQSDKRQVSATLALECLLSVLSNQNYGIGVAK